MCPLPSCFQENRESPPPQSPPFPGVSPSPEASCLPAVHCGWVSCPLRSPLSSPGGSLCHPTFSICIPVSPGTSESPEPTHPPGPPPWPRLPALPGGTNILSKGKQDETYKQAWLSLTVQLPGLTTLCFLVGTRQQSPGERIHLALFSPYFFCLMVSECSPEHSGFSEVQCCVLGWEGVMAAEVHYIFPFLKPHSRSGQKEES